MHNKQFRVTFYCAGVGHMQTMWQTTFHNLGILCQWSVRQFSLLMYAKYALHCSIRTQHQPERIIYKNYWRTRWNKQPIKQPHSIFRLSSSPNFNPCNFAINSMLFWDYMSKIRAVRTNVQSTMAVVNQNMLKPGPICKKIWAGSREEAAPSSRRLFISLQPGRNYAVWCRI